MLFRIIRSFNYNVRESEFHLNDINNCLRGHLCKLHYSGSVINPDWQCLAEQLLTDTDSAWLTVIILRWHQQLTVIECTQSQKISDTNSWQCFRYCKHSHFPSPHCHWHWQLTLTVINWHWQSATDTGNWQCLTAPSHILTWSWLYWEIRQTFLSSLNFLCFKHIQLIRLTVGWLKLTIHWKWSNQFRNLNKLL